MCSRVQWKLFSDRSSYNKNLITFLERNLAVSNKTCSFFIAHFWKIKENYLIESFYHFCSDSYVKSATLHSIAVLAAVLMPHMRCLDLYKYIFLPFGFISPLPPLSLPQVTTVLFCLCTRGVFFAYWLDFVALDSTWKWAMQYFSFYVWLILLNITSSRFTHAVTNGEIVFIFKTKQCSVACHNLFILLLMNIKLFLSVLRFYE